MAALRLAQLCVVLAALAGADAARALAAAGPAPGAAGAAGAAPRHAGRRLLAAPPAPAGRALQQAPDAPTCDQFVPHCDKCRFQSYRGTITRAVCSSCADGYVERDSGRACWCAPGYYVDPNSPDDCLPCGFGYWCPGTKVTKESGAQRNPCGNAKNTTTPFGRSDRECLVAPGYSWAPGDNATLCRRGTYNPGNNNRRCMKCAGSMVTENEGATDPTACLAPAGSYYLKGRGVPCAKGTYKSFIGNADCDTCPEGFSTAGNETGATSPEACAYVLAGFAAPANATLGVTPAVPCPADTYAPSDRAYDAAAGSPCAPCPAGMRTQDDAQTSGDACLAPPGSGFNATTGQAYVCPVGFYNPGWNREPCAQCGHGSVTTDGPGSTSEDQCVIPPGHYSWFDTTAAAPGAPADLWAAPCPADSYGLPVPTYGIVQIDCAHCLEGTTFAGEGATNQSVCKLLPGHGYVAGGVEHCAPGYWSAGGDPNPCNWCGPGYTTTAPGGAGGVAYEATGPDWCVIAAGTQWDMRSSGLISCEQGTYKSALGNSSCLPCPSGTTTTAISGAASVGECDACLPGYGVAAGASIAAAAPACGLCPSGTFSPGNAARGSPCAACPQHPGFTGLMVTRKGATTPELCVPEFLSDGDLNHETWDVIPMSRSALRATADATAEACQAACHTSAACQYFEFYADPTAAPRGVVGGPRCFVRDLVAWSRVDVNDDTKSYVAFEVLGNQYVAYEAHSSDSASLGSAIATYASRVSAERACVASAACIGYKFDRTLTGDRWATFAAGRMEGAVGKIRVVGESLTPWITDSIPLPGRR